MIGSISQGNSFNNVLKYALKPEKKPRVLGGNCIGETIEELSQEFKLSIANSKIKTPVCHIALAFAPEDDRLADSKKLAIANRVMIEMGYSKSIYVIIDHDRDDPGHKKIHDHDHIHIIASNLDVTGKKVKNSWNYWRLEKILRNIEQEEKFRKVINSKDSLRRSKNTKIKFNPIYYDIENTIVKLSQQSLPFKDFAKKLLQQKINIKLRLKEDGSVSGISYEKNGIAVAGYKMRNASYPKLTNRGIIIDPKNDANRIEELRLEQIKHSRKIEYNLTL